MILVITGGTGSLGSAILQKQDYLKQHGIQKIRVISRDEQKQVALTRSYQGEIPLDCYLGDVCDTERMAFALRDASYVIHAAAQKHIEKFELDIKIGYKTNILGTQSVADGFFDSKNAKKAIFVSTDKAASPITAYGVSKLAAEHLWLWYDTFQKEIEFKVARYGNILGSRGSVIETWTQAAQKQRPLKITDWDCTRFFMMTPDAASFVLDSLFHSAKPINIPTMKSIEMYKLAEVIWEHFNPAPAIFDIIGMRSIEKVHEELAVNGLTSEKAERFSKQELCQMYETWLKNQHAH